MPTWGAILSELLDLQERNFTPPPRQSILDFVRRKYLTVLNQRTGRNVILYATAWMRPAADPQAIQITGEDIQGLMEVIHGLQGNSVDIIIHSPGGSPEAAEGIVKYLRSRFNDIRVFVPHAAMSAATMLACSSNRIVMGKHSFLGPIDPQMIIPTENGRVAAPAHAILEQFAFAQQQCKNPGLLGSWLPILKQYGPSLIVQCQYAQDLSKELVSKWLRAYMFAGDVAAEQKANDAAAKLADHASFKTHGRFLSREDVQAFGLIIDPLEADQQLQDAVLSVFHATNHTFNSTGTLKIIENHVGKAFLKQAQVLTMPAIPRMATPPAIMPVPVQQGQRPAVSPAPVPAPAPQPPSPPTA